MKDKEIEDTVKIMAATIDFIIDKCDKYGIEDRDDAIKVIGENLADITEFCSFKEYKRKEK